MKKKFLIVLGVLVFGLLLTVSTIAVAVVDPPDPPPPQWLNVSGGGELEWHVLKPGTPEPKYLDVNIASNYETELEVTSSGNLVSTNSADTIEVWYSFGNTVEGAENYGWKKQFRILFPPFPAGLTFRIWGKIEVGEVSACEYEEKPIVRVHPKKDGTPVDVPFTVHASVAQWVIIDVNATKLVWKVVKPGDYSLPPEHRIVLEFRSNGDLVVKPYGFAHLKSTTEDDEIDAYYRIAKTGTGFGSWILAPAFNFQQFNISEDQAHNILEYQLDSRIVVDESDSACDYEDPDNEGFRVILTEQKDWIGPHLK